MKISMLLPPKYDERKWILARQAGIKHVVTKAHPDLSGILPPYDYRALSSIKKQFSDSGFTLQGLEGDQFDMSPVKLGLNSRDETIEKYCSMIENMGRLGMNLLCYNFMAITGWYRTKIDIPERGGALTSEFNLEQVNKQELTGISSEKLWENLDYFLHAVLPVAESNGVQMALHPDDPPVNPFPGTSRILISPEAFDRVLESHPSPSNGITFCQATFKLMGADIKSISAEWIRKNKIFFIHLRDIQGNKYNFRETFYDNGSTPMAEMIKHYHDCGFDGMIRSDHAPAMYGEEHKKFESGLSAGYNMLGHILAIGYIKGSCQAYGINIE